MGRIDLLATDSASLKSELQRHELDIYAPRSVGDIHTLIVGLGGGAGIALVIRAIGESLKIYFEGRAAIDQNDKVILKTAGFTIEANGRNVAEVVQKMTEYLDKAKAP